MKIDQPRLDQAIAKSVTALSAERNEAGYWEGELSGSALSTATAVTALAVWEREIAVTRFGHEAAGHEVDSVSANVRHAAIRAGLHWLVENQNADGGWGDTTLSFSNISTTALGWAAFGAVPGADEEFATTVERARGWLRNKAGGVSPHRLAEAITARYGKDRTFSVPILTMCTLAGRLGSDGWSFVTQLPFEMAAFPQQMFAALRLPVVSYALPALIAIGQVRHRHRPSGNPMARIFRDLTRQRTLRVLGQIQPSSGGFLEATPLTSFVTMSLAGADHANHPVALNGIRFILASLRPDGSWPIDTNLATWATTLSVNALTEGAELPMSDEERDRIGRWLLGQHYRAVHPYTNAAPGGWAWTDLSGGVPDADDTPGALLALHRLDANDPRFREAAALGTRWLLNLQNTDGGIPTFCRGWTNLPFDRSSPDLTAHTLRAWLAWRPFMSDELAGRIDRGIEEALIFLAGTQRQCGSWIPLWFGNQHAKDDENPTYGTAKVLIALNEFPANASPRIRPLAARAAKWLLTAQKSDGSWSGGRDWPASIEETALAIEALAGWPGRGKCWETALERAVAWLIGKVERGEWRKPSPIGFYFAKLWYFEKLYPQIYTVAALNGARRALSKESAG
jgi:squalene-hopene/tetraprenyl-beta-curcumene cyclase